MNDLDRKQVVLNEIELIKECTIGFGGVEIWGGIINEKDVIDFLKNWNFDDTNYRIVETVNSLKIQNIGESSDYDPETLVRVKTFGPKGDLDIRKDGNKCYWRFIGDFKPPERYRCENFWQDNSAVQFFTEDCSSYLWGRFAKQKNTWTEGKVAKADLNYPIQKCLRVKISYRTYNEDGITSFVRFMDLKGEGDIK